MTERIQRLQIPYNLVRTFIREGKKIIGKLREKINVRVRTTTNKKDSSTDGNSTLPCITCTFPLENLKCFPDFCEAICEILYVYTCMTMAIVTVVKQRFETRTTCSDNAVSQC